MELKDFVRDTIVTVFDAVQEAGKIIRDDPTRSGAVNPLWGGVDHVSNHEQSIGFDVAVTVGKTSENELKPGIKVLGMFELGGKMSDKGETSNVSRVSFKVPVAFAGTAVEGTTPQPRSGPAKAE